MYFYSSGSNSRYEWPKEYKFDTRLRFCCAFIKCQNNLTINESIYDCNSDANISLTQNLVLFESKLNFGNDSLVEEKELINETNWLVNFEKYESIFNFDNGLMREFIDISNLFSLKLHKFMSSAYPNIIFSPISISVLLSLPLRASSGNSYNQIFQWNWIKQISTVVIS